MAIMLIQEFEVAEDDHSTPNYDSVSERLDIESNPPGGLIVHSAGFTGKGTFRIADVWASESDWEAFRDGRLAEALKPMRDSGEGSPPAAEYTYELHDMVSP